jgi:hypothetical protein
LILLIAAMAMAAWLECDWLGDWMYVYDLLRMPRSPSGAAHISAIFLAYSFFAMTMILSVAAGRLAFSSSAPAWRKYPARAIVVAGVAGAAVGLASVYWRVIPISPREFAVSREVENPLEDALPLIDEFQSRNSRVVYARIVAKLQQPGRAPFDPQRDVHVESKRAQEAIQNKLLAFSYSLDADAKRGMHQKEFDSAVPYLIAKLQLGASLRRQGLLNQRASISAMLSNESVLKLHLIRNNISPESVRKICEALRQIELHREPFETSLQRDYAWEERATNWRARLRRTFDPDVPAGFQNGSQQWLRTMDGITVAMQRLLDTELAIHLFREKQGRLPQKLDELVPDYLDAVPLDPFSEQALVYRPENGSYLLYSVAPDGMDNQGRPGHLFEAFSYAPVDLDLDFFARPYSPSNRPILPAATKRRSPPP